MVKYSPLNADRSEIRVLDLAPGKSSDEIRCTLRTVSLHDSPAFEALSYVWGDAKITKPITVENEEFRATVNLEAGLRALRLPSKTRTLWVDAVCINQQDTPEKNVQVPLMGDIYTKASFVLVWFGPSTPGMELAISWYQTYVAKSLTGPGSSYWLKLDAKAVFSSKAKREKDMATLKALEGYFDLVGLSYWTRMWTFQEFCLATEDPLCNCGGSTFPSTMLQEAKDKIHTVGFEIMERLLKQFDRGRWADMSKEEQVQAEEFEKFFPVLKEKSFAVRRNVVITDRYSRKEWTAKSDPFLYLLYATAERECFDPRDKVFALYGMAKDVPKVYKVAYEKPVGLVMKETVAYAMHHERGPFIWASFGLRDERLSDTTYPSWVPDFRQAVNVSTNIHRGRKDVVEPLYQWKNGPRTRVTSDLTTVHMWARSLGTCKVALRFASDTWTVMDQIHALIRPDTAARSGDSLFRAIRKQDDLVPRLANACIVHQGETEDFSHNVIFQTFDELFRLGDAGKLQVANQKCRRMILSAAEKLIGKALIVTERGSFGVGVGAISDGDVVTIPPEMGYPLVLTPVTPTSGASGPRTYRMVGTAYIDGVIKDNFLDDELVSGLVKQNLEEFLIY
ncbi:HET-domain-containing protein [Xylariaceae sp. FL0016]|nr:HET-domain-containing protein [Xylariaceae sp. FL0016]